MPPEGGTPALSADCTAQQPTTNNQQPTTNNQPLLIALLETSDPNSPGSMRRYADLVELAFSFNADVQIERIGLAPGNTPRKVPSSLRTLWHHAMVARNARQLRRRDDVDLFHVIDGSRGYVASYLPRGRVVVTVHDVIPWLQCHGHFPVPPPSRAACLVINRAIHGLGSAEHLICDSAATHNDLNRALKTIAGRPSIIFPPLEPSFHSPTSSSSKVGPSDLNYARRDLPFVFHLGNNAFYKNREGVLEIFSRIASAVPHRMVMAGPPPTKELKQFAIDNGIDDRVDFLVNPSDDHVRTMYRTASLFLFPSRYEGFGWPPLEAMACGCPVVCSSAGSLCEVVGDAALTAVPDDIEALSRHCTDVLNNPSVTQSLRQAGIARASQFQVESFAAQLYDVYRKVRSANISRSESIGC